jgi:hypothetical protein
MHNLKTMTKAAGDRVSMMAWSPPMDLFARLLGQLTSDASAQVVR